jgi:hypothetical protein
MGEEALEETLTVAQDGLVDPLDLDQVDAGVQHP